MPANAVLLSVFDMFNPTRQGVINTKKTHKWIIKMCNR